LSGTKNVLGWNRQTLFYYPLSFLTGLAIYWWWRGGDAAVDEVMRAAAFGFGSFGVLTVMMLVWNLFYGLFVAPPPAQIIRPETIVVSMPDRTLWQRIQFLTRRLGSRVVRTWRHSKRGF